MIGLLREIRDQHGTSILFISHDLGLVVDFCDRVYVMYAGKIVEEGRVEDVFDYPAHPYTRALIEATPSLVRAKSDLERHSRTGPGARRIRRGMPVPQSLRLCQSRSATAARPTSHCSSRAHIGALLVCRRDLRWRFSSSTASSKASRSEDCSRLTATALAVKNVNLTVAPGETLGIVGESGSGKSTLLRMVLRLTKPTSGTILFKGKDVWAASGRELFAMRREIQAIFQDPASSFNPRQRIGAILEAPLDVHGIGDA